LAILDAIVMEKREEVARLRQREGELLRAAGERGQARGLVRALRAGDGVGVIAEFKRRSPSAGWLRREADAGLMAASYERAGAAALSVLTDGPNFGGSLADLQRAWAATAVPVLRKDFVIDEVQVLESRAAGADAVLLIVRLLDGARLEALLAAARDSGLDALVEVHDGRELERALGAGARLVGVNNRDLATFTTDMGVSMALASEVPPEVVLVAESGIGGAADVARLGEVGVDAVLVGEALMRAQDPAVAVRAMVACRRQRRIAGTKGADA
jgi:indole-3-glycerol phosphate synthase